MQMLLVFSFLIFIALFEIARFLHDRKKKNRQLCCPNPDCGYSGEGKEFGTFSTDSIFIVLLFLAIIPGIIYMLYFEYPVVKCPKCGTMISIPNR